MTTEIITEPTKTREYPSDRRAVHAWNVIEGGETSDLGWVWLSDYDPDAYLARLERIDFDPNPGGEESSYVALVSYVQDEYGNYRRRYRTVQFELIYSNPISAFTERVTARQWLGDERAKCQEPTCDEQVRVTTYDLSLWGCANHSDIDIFGMGDGAEVWNIREQRIEKAAETS